MSYEITRPRATRVIRADFRKFFPMTPTTFRAWR